MDTPDPAMRGFLASVRRAKVGAGEMALWYIGGAGYVLRAAGCTLLIDPFLGPSGPPDWMREVPPAFAPESIGELGPLDAVLISHEHGDHADETALAAIARYTDAPVHGSKESIAVAEKMGVPESRLHAVGTDSRFEIGEVRVATTTAYDPLATGCRGYVLEAGGVTLLHCGDSLYFEGFADIGERWRIDAVCVSVGLNPPGKTLYMDESDAARTARDCGARILIPQHFDLWRGLTLDPRRVRTATAWYAPHTKVVPARFGRRIMVSAR
jgi:L-ascorbate 6-phosphate lactonase